MHETDVAKPSRREVRRPARLDRPHYLFDPIGTLRRRLTSTPGESVLPWGLPLSYGPSGPMGNSIERSGIYDLAVTETVFRLLGDGDTAVDVGANVGYMTSVMAFRVGGRGHVVSFEPQPDIFATLQQNVKSWQQQDVSLARVSLHNVALSEETGERALNIFTDNDANHERASLREVHAQHVSITVPTVRLDDILAQADQIALLKLDVEHHELEVMRGGEALLGSVSTLVVEEHREPPTGVSEFLREHGFELFTVHESLIGPKLLRLERGVAHVGWGPPNILATRNPQAVQAAFAPRRWAALGRAARRTRARAVALAC